MFTFILLHFIVILPSAESFSNNFQGLHQQPPLNSKIYLLDFYVLFPLECCFPVVFIAKQ